MIIKQLLDEVIKKEGGYVNHPADKGGPTNFGITLAVLTVHRGKKCTADDVKAMSEDEARDIYEDMYYLKPKINLLPDALEPQVFDIAVNSGPGRAIKMLQQVLNLAGFECSVDGDIGPKTVHAAQLGYEAMGPYLVNALSEAREAFYQNIVARNPSQKVFLRGWINRARSFRVPVEG